MNAEITSVNIPFETFLIIFERIFPRKKSYSIESILIKNKHCNTSTYPVRQLINNTLVPIKELRHNFYK